MIIRPSLMEGLYMSGRQTSKYIFKLTCFHVQIFTNPHEYYDKSVSYAFASFHKYEYGGKSEWHYWQIHTKIIANPQEYHGKSELH